MSNRIYLQVTAYVRILDAVAVVPATSKLTLCVTQHCSVNDAAQSD